jgi:membrane associated rhomboid family serine protease
MKCNGEGSVQCPHCEGSGLLPAALPSDEQLERPCVFCHGDGVISCSQVCETCKGYGEIEHEELIEPGGTRREEYRVHADYVGWKILLACCILYIAGALSKKVFGEDFFLYLFALNGKRVLAGEWWRMVTCMFVHIGFWHFVLNAGALCMLSPPLEKLLGRDRFVCLYLLSGMAGNIITIMVMPDIWSAGASGAIYGLAGAYLGYHFRYRPFDAPLMTQILLFLLADLAMGFFPGLPINTLAHYGGLLGGLAISYMINLEKAEK